MSHRSPAADLTHLVLVLLMLFGTEAEGVTASPTHEDSSPAATHAENLTVSLVQSDKTNGTRSVAKNTTSTLLGIVPKKGMVKDGSAQSAPSASRAAKPGDREYLQVEQNVERQIVGPAAIDRRGLFKVCCRKPITGDPMIQVRCTLQMDCPRGYVTAWKYCEAHGEPVKCGNPPDVSCRFDYPPCEGSYTPIQSDTFAGVGWRTDYRERGLEWREGPVDERPWPDTTIPIRGPK